MTAAAPAKQEASISRTFDATPEQLWACITEPEHFAAWFGTPPFTTPVSTVTMDVRPGGQFAATMVHETDGVELPFRGTYVEVVPGEKIVQTLDDVTGQTDNHETLTLTVEGNRLTYHQAGQLPPEQYPLIEEGVNGFYNRLEEHLRQW
jgi:uncharacterized protein YndB with AHSA1/START domain